MTDPTIPELVARLRELRDRASAGLWIVDTCQGETAILLNRPPAVAIPHSARFSLMDAQLIAELVNALPTLLDALERGRDGGEAGRLQDREHYRQLVDALQRAGQAADLVCGTPIEDVPGLLLQRSTWRPIAECGELVEGVVYLGWFSDGAPRLVTYHLGKWIRYTDGGAAHGLTHVHRMGPIRGPGGGR